jgi:hypothetical protein
MTPAAWIAVGVAVVAAAVALVVMMQSRQEPTKVEEVEFEVAPTSDLEVTGLALASLEILPEQERVRFFGRVPMREVDPGLYSTGIRGLVRNTGTESFWMVDVRLELFSMDGQRLDELRASIAELAPGVTKPFGTIVGSIVEGHRKIRCVVRVEGKSFGAGGDG